VPAVFIALVLQAVFFGFGGISTLGVNTMNIALPGVLWALAFAPLMRRATSARTVAALGGAIAALSVASTALLVAAALALSDPAYLGSARLILATYLPLLVGETLITGFCCGFLARVRPDVFWFAQPGEVHG
jgi:cobalt/nickel transport system permease protein